MLHILFNINKQKIMMYVFKSSRKNEHVNVTVFTTSATRAFMLALMNFTKHGYKGSPVRLAL
jgi:hypothetical protein